MVSFLPSIWEGEADNCWWWLVGFYCRSGIGRSGIVVFFFDYAINDIWWVVMVFGVLHVFSAFQFRNASV